MRSVIEVAISILSVVVLVLFFVGTLPPTMRLKDEREMIKRKGFDERREEVYRSVNIFAWLTLLSIASLVALGTLAFFEFRGDRFADGSDHTNLYVFLLIVSGGVFLSSAYGFWLYRGAKKALKKIADEYERG